MTVRRSTKPMNAERSADREAVGAAAIALLARRDFARAELHAKLDRKSTRLNSSHQIISYAVFCLKKKKSNKACTVLHNVDVMNSDVSHELTTITQLLSV